MNRFAQLQLNDQGFAFDPSTGETFLVNRSGLHILSSLRKGEDEETAADILADYYGLTKSEARRDVNDFYAQLRSIGLV